MWNKIKNYLQNKNRLWKIAMIFSIALFLFVLFWFFCQIFTPKQQEIPPANSTASKPENNCPGCIRRLIDGVYAKPDAYNLPIAAVMIDNHPSARPPAGLEKASLVYEAEVEGYYTRLMAIFENSVKLDKIGPVRSARPYFIDWAQEMNAVYVHCGGSPEALVDLALTDITSLNEFYNGQYFWRADNRAAPHNIFTSSANLNKFLENKKITSSDFSAWQFKNDTPLNNASTTEKISINFNHPDFKTAWVYDKNDNSYVRYLGDRPSLTADSNLIIAKNIIIQYAPAKIIDDKLRLKMQNVGSGKAIICLDGSCQEGDWNKEDYKTRTKFKFKNGEEVKFNAGTTWIEVVRPEIEIIY